MERTKLVFATHNAHKAREIQELLGNAFDVQTLNDIGQTEEIPETEPTLEGNALQKSTYILEEYMCNVFSDDTGLEIEALNGEPGVYSARYAGEQKDNEANMAKVLEKLKGVSNRKAQFRTVISLYWEHEHYFFEGVVEGEITQEKSGSQGFGYDPIFKPNGYDVTFAEMSSKEKNAISHRGRAIRKMVAFLKSL